jgi:phage shock protein A
VVGEAPPDRGYLELLEQLSRAKGHIANLVTRKKRLQMRQASLRAALDAHVKRPLPPGNEEMTRAAQEFKQGLEAQLETLGRRIAELQALQEKLIESEHAVRLRVADSHTNSEVDHAHRSATAALADISDAAATVGQQIAHGDPDDPTPPIQDVTVTEQ